MPAAAAAASPAAASRRRSSGCSEEALRLLSRLNRSEGGSGSSSGRHSWRTGLIPASLQPRHRILRQFEPPASMLANVPGLTHPDLTPGQRSYLYSTAQIYSLDSTKRALSDSYYRLLMSELLKGGGRSSSHKQYSSWIYGNHKRLYEPDPSIWRSRRQRGGDGSESDRRRSAKSRQSPQGKRTNEESEENEENENEKNRKKQEKQAPPPRPVSAKRRPETPPAAESKAAADRPQAQQRASARPASSRRRDAASRGNRQPSPRQRGATPQAAARPKSGRRRPRDDAEDSDDSADEQRPRDLDEIMY